MSNLRLYPDLCKGVEGCGICLAVCRSRVFKPGLMLNQKGFHLPEIVKPESCTSCEDCMIFCPDLAIAVSNKFGKR
jgi:2-oxoglutarate ferredoxin oxidoreductase subunit delta